MSLSITETVKFSDFADRRNRYSVAEAAEKYYARAKDADKLYEAIEAKLTEQRRFVLWWDEQEKNPGFIGKPGPGRGHKTP